MPGIMDILAQLLNPQGGGTNRLAAVNDRMGDAGNYLSQPFAPQQMQAMPPVQQDVGAFPPAPPPQGAAPMAAPQQVPQAMPAPSGGGLGGGIGGFLNNLLGGQGGGGANQTVSWLQKQGMDPMTAVAMASNKPALQKFLLDRADPRTSLETQKLQLEIESQRNPKPDYITGRDGSIFAADRNGIKQVYGGKPDLPTQVQEYEYARNQGYNGSFQDFQVEQKKAGASQVNIDQKAEGAFDKKLAENQATILTDMATEGMNAKADLAVLGELEGLLGQNGGTMSGLSSYLAKYGIGGEGQSDIQAAQALINKLVPSQRQPGSGTMSDRDVELFTRSLPSLWNAPGGNQKILNVMRGLAQYKQQQGDIATAVMNNTMSRQDATTALRNIPNPLAGFRDTAAQGAPKAGAVEDGYRFKGGDPGDPSSWEKVQ